MLETYFAKPKTVDRIRVSWIGSEVERYVGWLAEQGYGARCVWRRVPLALAFGEFAREATEVLVDAFADVLSVLDLEPTDAETGLLVKQAVARHGAAGELRSDRGVHRRQLPAANVAFLPESPQNAVSPCPHLEANQHDARHVGPGCPGVAADTRGSHWRSPSDRHRPELRLIRESPRPLLAIVLDWLRDLDRGSTVITSRDLKLD